MADAKISALPEATTLVMTDVLAVVSAGATKKVQVQNLLANIPITNTAVQAIPVVDAFSVATDKTAVPGNVGMTYTRTDSVVDATKDTIISMGLYRQVVRYNSAGETLEISPWSLA